MKKVRFFSMLCASVFGCSSTLAHADMVIVEQLDNGDGKPPQETTTKIKGDLVRIDAFSKHIIFDGKSNVVISLIPERKKYLKIPKAYFKTILKKSKSMLIFDKTPIPVDTGSSEKIVGYNTEIYTLDMGNAKSKTWYSKDFPNYQEINAKLKNATGDIIASIMSQKIPELPAGMVVKSENTISLDIAGQHVERKITRTLISAKEQPIDDSEFAVPADFTEVKMPIPSLSDMSNQTKKDLEESKKLKADVKKMEKEMKKAEAEHASPSSSSAASPAARP